MDASEAMTVLRNRRILSVFAAVSYPRSTVISMLELTYLPWGGASSRLYRAKASCIKIVTITVLWQPVGMA